jgi:hypothetical protein
MEQLFVSKNVQRDTTQMSPQANAKNAHQNVKNVPPQITVPNVNLDSYLKENVDLAKIPISLTPKPEHVIHVTIVVQLVLAQMLMTVPVVTMDTS